MLYRLITVTICFVLGGCNMASKKNEPAPEDFIIRQDTTYITQVLNSPTQEDYAVKFRSGVVDISDSEKETLLSWLQTSQPTVISIRGTAGAEKYRNIGNDRASNVVNLLKESAAGIDLIVLDYDPSLAGGRALIYIPSDQLASQIQQTAQILIINSD